MTEMCKGVGLKPRLYACAPLGLPRLATSAARRGTPPALRVVPMPDLVVFRDLRLHVGERIGDEQV